MASSRRIGGYWGFKTRGARASDALLEGDVDFLSSSFALQFAWMLFAFFFLATAGLLIGGLYYGTSCFQLVRVSISVLSNMHEPIPDRDVAMHTELHNYNREGRKLVPNLPHTSSAAAEDLELDKEPRLLLHVHLQPQCTSIGPV